LPQRRALRVAKALNDMEGVSCNPVEGALYAFPRIRLPAKAIAAAAAAKKPADTFYALALLGTNTTAAGLHVCVCLCGVVGVLYVFACFVHSSQSITYRSPAPADATGICVVPGTGFKQEKDTFHFRTTILPGEELLDGVIASMQAFHKDFMKKWA
jgi:aspartate/methionine/tyrosine aminotransferase